MSCSLCCDSGRWAGDQIPSGHQGRPQGAPADRRHPVVAARDRRGTRGRDRPHRRRVESIEARHRGLLRGSSRGDRSAREAGPPRARRPHPQHRIRLAGHDRLPGSAARAGPRSGLRSGGGRRPAVCRDVARRADGRRFVARPHEWRLRQLGWKRRRAQAGAEGGRWRLRGHRTAVASRPRRRRGDRRDGREAGSCRRPQRPDHHRPLRADP